MKSSRRLHLILVLTVTAWMMVVLPAHAYIDPGSTSVVFTALLAGLAAAGTAISMFWARITGLFRRRRPDSEQAPEAEHDPEPADLP